MASRICVVLWGFLVFGLASTAQAARLTINIEEREPTANSVTIACMASDIGDSAKEVDVIQILKEFPGKKKKMIVHIDQKSNEVRYNNDIVERLKGNGEIDTSNPSNSFLSLTSSDPKTVDEGEYLCEVYFKNWEGYLQHTVSTGTVTLPKKSEPVKPEVSKSDLKTLQEQMKVMMSKQEAKCNATISQIKEKLDYHVSLIERREFVPKDQLKGQLKKIKESLTPEVDQLKNALKDFKKDMSNQLGEQDKEQDADLAYHVTAFENVTNNLANKTTVMKIESRVETAEILIEKLTKTLSQLSDTVAVLKFIVQPPQQVPETTATPTKDPLIDVMAKVNSLEKQSLNQTQDIAYLMDKAESNEANMAAFSVRIHKDQTAAVGKVIMFDDVKLNKGQAYDKSTGAFTAPRAGIYAFHLVLLAKVQDELIDVVLKVNGKKTLFTLTTKEKDREDQAAVSVVTELKAGDEVNAVVKYTSKSQVTKLGEMSAFSGYFIQPL